MCDNAGLACTGCGSNNTESAGNTSSNAASDRTGDGEKVVLNVINYHVGTRLCADYYSYLFDSISADRGRKKC